MKEYLVVRAHDFATLPDDKKAQKECDKAAADGWRLVTATVAVAYAAGGRLLLFFERDKNES